MSKKKGGKRLNKKLLAEMLQTLFQQHPNETFTMKLVFRSLKLDTHPTKMMAIDLMEEMALNPQKRLKSLTIRTLSNDVVIGLIAITLQ